MDARMDDKVKNEVGEGGSEKKLLDDQFTKEAVMEVEEEEEAEEYGAPGTSAQFPILPTGPVPIISSPELQKSDDSSAVSRPAQRDSSMNPCVLGNMRSSISSARSMRRSTSKDIESDVSFSVDEPEFVRAVPLSSALRIFGKHWKDSTGSDFTYNLSAPACHIDVFFSHSWQTTWWMKVIGIIYYHNVMSSYAIATVLHVLLLGLTLAGQDIPVFSSGVAQAFVLEGDVLIPVGFSFKYVPGCLAFILALSFGQRCALRRKSCFLDKMCINQTDPVKKHKGVRQLGALLRFSEQMMVLWQPEYLGRLWCVFELAAFSYMHGHRENALIFYPLKRPMLALCVFGFHLLSCLSLSVVSPLLVHSDWHLQWLAENVYDGWRFVYLWGIYFVTCFAGLYFLPSMFLWRFCRDYARDADFVHDQLIDFRVARAHCFLESDREYVIGCIKRWFRSVHQFEDFVQNELRGIVLKRNGNNMHSPWGVIIVGSLSHLLLGTNLAVDCFLAGATVSASNAALMTIFIAFCSDILALNLTLRMASSSFFEDVEPSSCTLRNLVGPISTACLFAATNGTGLAVLTANPPLWVGCCMLAVCTILNVIVAKPDWLSCRGMPGKEVHPEPYEGVS
eukprot:TRINITY_DN22533_c0_g2_i1.p1 TRINITY_DN22533_c0_g2~~TRINITY_DN22533_c0_g2_i1.p1  ORF type:complete len:621 (-),score=87.66 TRINITY_DN22533_c0_g2_i1:53-1915(-)